ncbi:hypothetical protein BBJ28_00014263 [Nothophytophthora sp. Chile5]|nr:hypothetical protein BBJ28_00014263 [Nothophytophthora sp. Chile5]
MQWRRTPPSTPRGLATPSVAASKPRTPAVWPLHQRLAGVTAAVSLLLVAESWWHSGSSIFEELENTQELDFYPDELLLDAHSELNEELSEQERVHLALLHEGCVQHKDSVITWEFGRGGGAGVGRIDQDDPQLIEKLGAHCPDVEVFLPAGIRGDGYCEDAMGYVKLTDTPSWPANKPKYLMPNVEMYELQAHHYWDVDVVLCKTAICARRVRMWYQQEGNPRHARVLYTRHTSSDAALYARHQRGASASNVKPKNFSDVRFVHTAGKSMFKGTTAVLDCWLTRSDFPPVDVFVDQNIYDDFMKETYEEPIRAQAASRKITLHTGRVPADVFGKLMLEAAFLLCTSVLEGYGHYINQARANAALIVTTDSPPMNELLSPKSAVLVPHPSSTVKQQLLGGSFEGEHGLRGVQGMATYMKGADICDAVERVLEMTATERQAMGERARRQYVLDTHFFAARMQQLRAIARAGDSRWYLDP